MQFPSKDRSQLPKQDKLKQLDTGNWANWQTTQAQVHAAKRHNAYQERRINVLGHTGREYASGDGIGIGIKTIAA